jgi:hypothetical protein
VEVSHLLQGNSFTEILGIDVQMHPADDASSKPEDLGPKL